MKTNQVILISTLLVVSFVLLNALSLSGSAPWTLVTSDMLLAMYLSFLIVALLPSFSKQSVEASQKKEENKPDTFF
ncbi:MAG: hypothetical protein LZF61_08845 [Nitrosomonas sp.]|nr:MAG: hypothetical protein LZF61_08845 [Nitrosomonas sp.]